MGSTHHSDTEHWAEICRRHFARSPHLKRAGGDEVSFEQAFSNLAHSYLRNKAPELLNYELGFQLVDKDDDNQHAVGMFGFKVGEHILHAPVFFVGGELKGNELLHIKDSDTFVPKQQNWVNYIINRKPVSLGEGITRNTRSLGVEQPDISSILGNRKFGSDRQWLTSGLTAMGNALSRLPETKLLTPKIVKQSADVAHRFLSIVAANPILGKKIISLYGPEFVKAAMAVAATAKTACPTRPVRISKKSIRGSCLHETPVKISQDLKIYIYDGNNYPELTTKQAEDLFRDGMLVLDNRKETSVAFKELKKQKLSNPTTNGPQDVLCRPGDFEKCLVLIKPNDSNGEQRKALVFRWNGGKLGAWNTLVPHNIFVAPDDTAGPEENWFKSLPDGVKTLTREGGPYVAITPTGESTCVFEVSKSASGSDGKPAYLVYWQDTWGCTPKNLPIEGTPGYEYNDPPQYEQMVTVNALMGGRIKVRMGNVLLPKDAKIISLKENSEVEDVYDHNVPMIKADRESPKKSKQTKPIMPGTIIDMHMGIQKMSEELCVINDGIEATINGRRGPVKSALISLITHYGMREKHAKKLLKTAQRQGGYKGRIKLAQPPYPPLDGNPSAPFPDVNMMTDPIMGSGTPAIMPQTSEMPAQGMYSTDQYDDMAAPPEPQLLQQLLGAAETGQQEVLDTSMFANLLKSTRDDQLIDSNLDDFIKCLDKIGRLLFNLYWHRDKFEERFGDDMQLLEDSLRNNFESLGDLALMLKQKAVEPYPEEVEVNLEKMQ